MSIFLQGSPWSSRARQYPTYKEHEVSYRAKWTFPLCEHPLKDMITSWYLCQHGHTVPLFTDQTESIQEWCREHIKGAWAHSEKLITDEQFREELEHRVREGDLGPSDKPLKFEVKTVQVNASSRRLPANWTMEVQAPMRAIHHHDIEQELMDELSREIQREIDSEVVDHLKNWRSVGRRAIQRSRPKWFFAFADSREATLFKLTWGGE